MALRTPKMEPPVTPILDEETFEEFSEWAFNEEAAFLKILEDSDLFDDGNI